MLKLSNCRQSVLQAMERYKFRLDTMGFKNKKVLEVGIAGDEEYKPGKRGGNYTFFSDSNEYKTLDILKEYNPDFVGDICNTEFKDGEWDLVILSQTIEHIWTPKKAVKECSRIIKTGGFLILDCPWNYPQHEELGFGDYWRITPMGIEKLCDEAGLYILESQHSPYLVSVLAKKNE